jgi:hypothetical protein
MQEKPTTLFNVQNKVNAITMKIGRWITRLDHHELDTFKTMNYFVAASGGDIPIQILDAMREHVKGLKNNFRSCFPDLDPHMKWI